MNSVELMNNELEFLENEVPDSVEHLDWTHEVFPDEYREIYDPENKHKTNFLLKKNSSKKIPFFHFVNLN